MTRSDRWASRSASPPGARSSSAAAPTDGRLGSALSAVPHATRGLVEHATRQGFLSGLNAIIVIGALLALAGAVIALWLVREHEIERERPELVTAPVVTA